MINILLTCNNPGLASIISIIKNIVTLVQIIVPILLMIATLINLVKLINNPDDKKIPKRIFNSLMAAIIVFFVPMIINITMSMLGESFTVSSCWNSVKDTNTTSNYIETNSDKEKSKIFDDNYQKGNKKKQDNGSGSTNSTVTVVTSGLSSSDFNSKLSSMSTPSNSDLINAAKANGIDENYLIIIVGTTQREGYVNDPYLNYGWASAMMNNKVSIETMQGWDPYHSGDANYYSWVNIQKGYSDASDTTKKSVYLALTNRNKKIVECNGMYSTTPSSYNLIYKSDKYNCSIYEKK